MFLLNSIDEPGISQHARKIQYKVNENDCWECISHTLDSQRKYPIVTRWGKQWRMSRYIFTLFKGYIPKDHFILHSCDNPLCINPEHLRTGTPKENSMDMVSKGRQAKGLRNGGGVKLDEMKVVSIRNDSRSLKVIAKEYGVSKRLIQLVKQKKIWKHVI